MAVDHFLWSRPEHRPQLCIFIFSTLCPPPSSRTHKLCSTHTHTHTHAHTHTHTHTKHACGQQVLLVNVQQYRSFDTKTGSPSSVHSFPSSLFLKQWIVSVSRHSESLVFLFTYSSLAFTCDLDVYKRTVV